MARKTEPAAPPAAVPAGVPAAPPIGGARTFAEMEELARRHAGMTTAPVVPVETPAETAPEQEAPKDE